MRRGVGVGGGGGELRKRYEILSRTTPISTENPPLSLTEFRSCVKREVDLRRVVFSSPLPLYLINHMLSVEAKRH